MVDCVFCKIVNCEIPAENVYEDERVLAFMDIHPINPGHVLVISKAHYASLLVTPHELASYMLGIVQKVGGALIKGLQADGFNVGVNNGAAAGQVIGHTHYHVIPRFANDGLKHWPGKEYQEGQMQSVAVRVKKEMK